MRKYSEAEKKAIGQRVRLTIIRKKLNGGKVGRPPIVVNIVAIIERLEMGEDFKNICEEYKIKKSALYRKLKAYRTSNETVLR